MSGQRPQQSTLPGGAAMAPGETELVSGRFMYSTTAFYLWTELVLTNRRFVAARPNTLLGLIPVGTRRSNFPFENIAGVSAGTRFSVGGLVLGILALLVGLAALGIPNARTLGFILLILGASAIIGAPKQAIEVMNSGGGTVTFPVSFFERHQTLEFASKVAEALARQDRRAGPAATYTEPARQAAPTGDTRAALRHLEELRNDGVITEQEYAAKRADVISRL